LDLHRHCRQNCFLETIELVKATPGTALDETDEYATHRLHINALCYTEQYNSILLKEAKQEKLPAACQNRLKTEMLNMSITKIG